MKNILIVLSIIIVIVVGVSVGYFKLAPQNATPPSPTPSAGGIDISQLPLTTPVATSSVQPTLNQENTLKAGGNSYLDPKGVYVFLYPNDYKIDTQGDGQYTRIYKTGATQRGQTEMYDGIIMVFETVKLQGQTMDQWVDQRIKESTADGTVEITQPKKPTTMNKYPGFTYKARGLGEADYLIIQKSPTSEYVVSITTSVSDPQQKNYQKEVDAVLAGIELLK